jgi:ADP-ribose pyrophosphatase YjhB (NUDIX family)
VLPIRTKHSKRWSLPKGNAESHLSLGENAAKEAFEEAGVRGEVYPAAAGIFRAAKRAWRGETVIEVWVYLLRVTGQKKHWREEGEREVK